MLENPKVQFDGVIAFSNSHLDWLYEIQQENSHVIRPDQQDVHNS